MSKFVAGDLVTLSSAGKKNQHNLTVVGLIGRSDLFGRDDHLPMKEYEIKFAKAGNL